MKLAIFDLDGTLNRTDLFAVPAALKALREFGSPVDDPNVIRGTFGMDPFTYTKIYFPEAEPEFVRKYLDRAAQLENEMMLEYGKPFDGIPAALESIRNSGVKTAVCSNASMRYIVQVLSTLNLLDLFDFIQPMIRDLSKNESLRALLERVKPERAVMVGDRIFDLDAARANGIPFIGCLYGFCPEEMETSDLCVNSAAELPEAVAGLLKRV